VAAQLRVPVARIAGKRVNSEVLRCVPAELAEKYRCLPLFLRQEPGGRVLYVAFEDPGDREALEELAFQLGERLSPVLIGPAQLDAALERHYRQPEPVLAHPEAPAMQPGVAPPAAPAGDAGDSQTQPEFPVRDPLLHPAPGASGNTVPQLADALGYDTAPDFGPPPSQPDSPLGSATGTAAEDRSAAVAAPPIPAAEARPDLVVHALSQLLIEKGVVEPGELAERLRRLSATSSGA
jgi:hypothetical protein